MSKNRKSGNFIIYFLVHFVPGRPGTEEFVPGHLLLPLSRDSGTGKTFLSRDKGTTGQAGDRAFFWSRDKGTSHPGLSRDVPSLGNPCELLTFL